MKNFKSFPLLVFTIAFLFTLTSHAFLIEGVRKVLNKRQGEAKAESDSLKQAENFRQKIFKAPITPNNIPNTKCKTRDGSLELPGSPYEISQFEIWTLISGNMDREPNIVAMIKLRERKTLNDVANMTIPVKALEQGWVTDRLGHPKAITETTYRKNLDIDGTEFSLVFKRNIPHLDKPMIHAEAIVYSTGENPTVLSHARCTIKLNTDPKK